MTNESALTDQDPIIRLKAVRSAVRGGGGLTPAQYERVIFDWFPGVKLEALQFDVHNKPTVAQLNRLLTDSNAEVRNLALRMIVEAGNLTADQQEAALVHPNPAIRVAAIKFGSLTPVQHKRALIDNVKFVRDEVKIAMGGWSLRGELKNVVYYVRNFF